ncbi:MULTISPECIES: DUF5710 domain-containing protein [Yersinia pseudotuberculosis complex]|uniref:Uncharacterized protein n=1 Tax=Yersinia pseudotuberculosis serotype O:1b (strain IP 31758) TaxID=349747 RepID=A0A0U1QTN2_YERP3|nr:MULTISPECIES: DUF5710 domain-containing protein [Yersinia pseudotuberculosis complex]ABS45741.1 conserved hypothetical protein [Yersinia pseudotuberculosis IP 31758]MCE4113172.1 DUF5710 domain-containing protein [Yersinia pseudotuberculosis]RYC26197.1 DUF87 domain-containing protein [Yersinia pseudotuberculosis]UFA64009.1 DUF87 domain-containing protein [Yersinia pseudotuberculosis]WLF06059.1 DUF5710 domain-containing protein [Yersinia pseudotuberculosis]
MKVIFGLNAGQLNKKIEAPVTWDSKTAVNGHCLLVGMSGAGKTYNLRSMIRQMIATYDYHPHPLRIHILDVHGDIEIEGASTVMFSEQTNFGMNPLRVNPDQHFGGVRKRVQGFVSTLNKVMHSLGPKQEACLRNLLNDLYEKHGFKYDDASTWRIEDDAETLISAGQDGRLYLDIPIEEKDQAKALGARWDSEEKCWFILQTDYEGGITRWGPKTKSRTNPSMNDLLRYARNVMLQSFMGTGIKAVTNVEILNKAAAAYQRKLLAALKQGDRAFADEKLQSELEKAKEKAIDSFTAYADSIVTGRELGDVIKYDSTDVLKSVVDKIENLNAIGIFKSTPPPFDNNNPIWRYNIKALSFSERKLFALFKLEEIFVRAIQRGEQYDVCEIIVLDEAHIYTDDDPENIINNIAKEARKFGLAIICASQSPTHFVEDLLSSVATKVILGIDESFWKGSVSKMGITIDALKWIKPTSTMLVQIKAKGSIKTEWQWTVIPKKRVI